jgi:glycosyltransferase involved in cell wall biosynthesis
MRQHLHKLVWQRLPRGFRRRLLLRTTQALAPKLVEAPERSGRIIVAGYLRTSSGLGESARLCYDALRASGATVAGIDLSGPMMQDQHRADFQFEDGSQSAGAGTLILHVNAPWIPFALLLLGRRLIRGKRIIGYWHWELPEVPNDWNVGYPFVHEIWVPTRFVEKAVARSNPGKPVRIMPHPVALRVPQPKKSPERSERPFTVLVIFNMGSSLARKNPFAAIEAFRAAFGDDASARLVIKATNSELYEEGFDALLAATTATRNIRLVTCSFSPAQMDTLYEEADVVMSLHRSEGFGFVIAEAMLRGLPVVATNWSGNCDFLNESNGMPVRWTPAWASDPQGEYDQSHLTWADPDIGDASAKLKALRDDPRLRAELGHRAREDAVRRFSVASYHNLVAAMLDSDAPIRPAAAPAFN